MRMNFPNICMDFPGLNCQKSGLFKVTITRELEVLRNSIRNRPICPPQSIFDKNWKRAMNVIFEKFHIIYILNPLNASVALI